MNIVLCNASACFAHKDGHCIALNDNDFGDKKCPFFKTKAQVEKERKKSEERLRKLWLND